MTTKLSHRGEAGPARDSYDEYLPIIQKGQQLDQFTDDDLAPRPLSEIASFPDWKVECSKRGSVPWVRLEESWLIATLRIAAEAGHQKVFRTLLLDLMTRVNVEVPPGIVKPPPKRPRGRPISQPRKDILSLWRQLGEPSPSTNDLAREVYGTEFTKADARERRKMRDRTRRSWERAADALIAQNDREIRQLRSENAELKAATKF